MTYSKNWLDLANRALVKTGNQQIESFTDGAENSQYINTLLPEAVENVASMFPWRCLTQRLALAPSDTAPAFGFDYAYPLPADLACLIEVIVDTACSWKREAGNIVTDSTFCNVIYLKLPAEPTDLTPILRELVVLRLAYNIVQTTTSNTTLMTQLGNEFTSALTLAERADTQAEEDTQEWEGWNNYR